ncbi:MAG: NAD-dependent epimerase/dehydratase family protein [Desulfoferrobacter sp.]
MPYAVNLWGSGIPRREFLHVDDLASACVFLMNLDDHQYDSMITDTLRPIINLGCGEDTTIKDLANLIANISGYQGGITWDTSKPDGTPRKLLDISKITRLGWKPKIGLEEGIRRTYEEYLKGVHNDYTNLQYSRSQGRSATVTAAGSFR